jgi:hypothetical protein
MSKRGLCRLDGRPAMEHNYQYFASARRRIDAKLCLDSSSSFVLFLRLCCDVCAARKPQSSRVPKPVGGPSSQHALVQQHNASAQTRSRTRVQEQSGNTSRTNPTSRRRSDRIKKTTRDLEEQKQEQENKETRKRGNNESSHRMHVPGFGNCTLRGQDECAALPYGFLAWPSVRTVLCIQTDEVVPADDRRRPVRPSGPPHELIFLRQWNSRLLPP